MALGPAQRLALRFDEEQVAARLGDPDAVLYREQVPGQAPRVLCRGYHHLRAFASLMRLLSIFRSSDWLAAICCSAVVGGIRASLEYTSIAHPWYESGKNGLVLRSTDGPGPRRVWGSGSPRWKAPPTQGALGMGRY